MFEEKLKIIKILNYQDTKTIFYFLYAVNFEIFVRY